MVPMVQTQVCKDSQAIRAIPEMADKLNLPSQSPALSSLISTSRSQPSTEAAPQVRNEEGKPPTLTNQLLPTDVYDISGARLALTFCVMKGRQGAEKDLEALGKMFEALGFENEVVEDPLAEDFKRKLVTFRDEIDARKDLVSCSFIILMAHGSGDTVSGADGKTMKLEELFTEMTNETCQALRGKPKVFVIQACRGDKEDKGVLMKDSSASDFSATKSSFISSDCNNQDVTKLIPTHSDSLFIYSSAPGYATYRNPKSGSWLIQSLVEVFTRYQGLHLLELLTKVIQRVSEEGSHETSGGKTKSRKASPVFQSSMRKLLYVQQSAPAFRRLSVQPSPETYKLPFSKLPAKEDLTLDPATAHPELEILADGKEVRCVSFKTASSNPRRFDTANCVVARHSFSAGWHYWEVFVGWKRRWNLGVVSDLAERWGRLIQRKSWWPWSEEVCTEGYWLIGYNQEKTGKKYCIFDTNPWPIDIRPQPQTIRVCLDYEAGEVSFYNADCRNALIHLHTFHTTFHGAPIYPVFDPCWHDKGDNTQPLKIL